MLTGTLDAFSVTEILSMVGRAKRTGALRVRSGDAAGTIYCRRGEVTFACAAQDTGLGDLLVRAGFLGPAIVDEAQATPEPAKRVTDALVKAGVDPVRVQGYMRHQTEESIFELDRWRSGELRFDSDDDHSLGDFFRYPAQPLLEAVGERQVAWTALERKLGSPDRVVEQAPAMAGDDDEVRISKQELQVLRAVDGQRTVRELAHALNAGLFQTCQIVAGLLDARLVVMLDAPSTPRPAAPAPRAHESVNGSNGNGHGANGHSANGDGGRALEFSNGHVNGNGNGAAAKANGSNGHGHVNGNGNGHAAAAAGAGGATTFVEPGDGPARDLILRLLSAVKEEL